MEPVFTDVALDHKPAHIVRLPADTVQRGRRHLPTVPKQRRNEAGRGFNPRAGNSREQSRARTRSAIRGNPTSDVSYEIDFHLVVWVHTINRHKLFPTKKLRNHIYYGHVLVTILFRKF